MNISQSSMQLQKGEEPPMYLQRPSSARSQDVSHVLARTFRQLFTRDTVAPDTVQYLGTSKGGEDAYHEKYVEQLQRVQAERERRLTEAAMLERHIMQAQARAMSADERALQRMNSTTQGFPDLGLPPARSHLRSCLDSHLMRKHNLLVPEDFNTQEPPLVPPPTAPDVPPYARTTQSSDKRTSRDPDVTLMQTPLPSFHESLSSEGETASGHGSLPLLPDSARADQCDVWKAQMGPEEREVNRRDLTNLEGRVDYLKNPRYVAPGDQRESTKTLVKSHKRRPKETGIKPKPEPVEAPEPEIFIPSPPVVTFTNYKVGQVYELTLELKNVTTALRPVRVVPPGSQYFSVGLGQFPGEQGLVAPGMSCHYRVRFMPDSLADFDDVLTVQTQSSSPLLIPLRGRRPPPILTLPERIDVGQCLVGGVKVGQFTVRNDGGDGRFCLMPTASWPNTNFKSVASVGTVNMPPFELCPPRFELLAGQCMTLEVLFSPGAVQTYTQQLTVVCDNCHVRHFTVTGEGQTAAVELVSVEDGLSEAQAGELTDLTASHLIRFNNLNPFTYVQRTVTVRNAVNVGLPYNWLVVKPYIKATDPTAPEDLPVPTERVQDMEAVFSIEPDKGVLPPGGTSTFTVTFAPPEVKAFHSVLHLVLRNIPAPPPDLDREATRDSESGENLHTTGPKRRANRQLPTSEPIVTDLTGLEVAVKGECEPLQVLLQPYAVHIPGQVLVETAVKNQFRMLNHSLTSIVFQWENVTGSDYVIQVEPPIGELGALCELDFDVCVCGSRPGPIDHTLLCHVQHLPQPLMLHIQAHIKGPEVVIERSDVNFGLVRFGEVATETVDLSNICRVPAVWSIRESPTHTDVQTILEDNSEFQFSPCGGELRPLETVSVTVMWRPRQCKSLHSVFEVLVEGGSQSSLLVSGETQSPQVCLLSCHLPMPEVYLDVPTAHQVVLLNQTLLDTTFQWGQVEGDNVDFVSVQVEPPCGHLASRVEHPVTIHFTAHTTGELSELRIPCEIAGMDQPLYLSLQCDVKGLSVAYRAHPEEQDDCLTEGEDTVLDLGADNTLGVVPKCVLYIQNLTAITAPFSLHVEHFYAKPPTPPDVAKPQDFMPNKIQRRSALLGKTPNLADPLAKTAAKQHSDLCKSMLVEGRGAAFTAVPSSGMLQPFGEQRVEVSGFSDMWGRYTDRLQCKVGQLDFVYIPLQMGIHGNSLYFQMVAAQQHTTPVVRFGTHVSGVRPITRQMRINNPGPFDLRVDWQVFNTKPEDNQLLDMMVTYGKPFPLKDASDREIVPPGEGPPQLERDPTDYIPNTPDSTPAVSREVTQENDPPSLAERRHKVISVTLREHGGVEGCEPYCFVPSQLVVPSRGYNTVGVRFTPFASTETPGGEQCLGYALGYMSLDEKVRQVEGKVERDEHFSVTPLRLDMTAHVKPALLNIECTEEEGMRYMSAASDLMLEGKLMPECLKLCSTTLSNNTETPLVFKLVTKEPFLIVELHPVTKQPLAQVVKTELISLKPRQSALVQVGFGISLDLLKYLPLSTPWEGPPGGGEGAPGGSQEGGAYLEEGEQGERRIHFLDHLMVFFNNNTTQRLPLHASLSVPSLSLSKESVDFGTCLVGQRREVQLIITNPSASDSYWTLMQESRSCTADEGTFSVTPSSGLLHAHVTLVSQNRALIQVFFTAKHNEDYEAVYLFHGMLGEEPCRLYLKGRGSYDGKHEALVNV